MDDEERNYCCLVLLLNRVGLVKLRKFFIDEWNTMHSGVFVPWTDSHQNGIDLLTMYNPYPAYERPKVQSGDTTKWDVSLFVKVLLNSRPSIVHIVNKALVDGLTYLRETRNKYFHTASGKITSAEFTPLFNDVRNALLLVGASALEVKKVEDDVQKLELNKLLSLVKQCSDQDKDILQGVDTISNRLDEIQQGQEDIKQGHSHLQQGQEDIKQGQSSLQQGQEAIKQGQSSLQQGQEVIKQGIKTGIDELKHCLKDELSKGNPIKQGSSKFPELSNLEFYSHNLKKTIEKRTDRLTKKIVQTTVKTDDIFTNLTLHHQEQEIPHQRAQEVEELARKTLHGRKGFLHQERAHKVNQGARKTVTEIKQCLEIFVDENKENNPKSILVSGEPGIGKTLFSQKIVRDWSTNNLLIPDIKFTYLITFRQLTRLANKELTLRGLLNHSLLLNENTMITEEIMAHIVQHPEQLFIVFDGFDEYKDRYKIMGDFQEQFPNDVKAKMPVTALVSNLIRKEILSDSVTMITSRPSEANALNENIHFERYVEITGFSETQVVKYVENYFKSKPEEVKKLAVDKVKGSPHHISFGRAPFRCFLMCIFIECEVENNRDISVPATLTDFYDKVIKCIERNYNREILKLHSDEKAASEAVDKTIDNFAELAANLTQQGRFSFTSEDLENLNSTEKEMLLSSNLIFCYPVSSNSPFQKLTCEYSLTHFTIQEFFVALYLVKKGVMAAQESTEMVYTFMSGLLGLDKNKESMVKLLECLGEHIKDKERLRLVSLRCLHEFQDKDLTEQEVTTNRDYRYWDSNGWIELDGVTDTDCGAAIAMLVESTATSIPSRLNTLDIRFSSITSVGVERLLLSLVHSNHTIAGLFLTDCGLNDECAECLGKYLLKTKITELYLDDNEITDGGVQHIMEHIPSNLTVLSLGYNKITDGGVQHIMAHIPSNLTELDLDGNEITDEVRESSFQFCQDNHPGLLLII